MTIPLKPLAAVALAASTVLVLGSAVPTSAGYLDDDAATASVVTAPPGAYTPTDLNRAPLTGAAVAGGSVYLWGALGGGLAGNGKWNVAADGPSDPTVRRVDLPITSDPATTRPAQITQFAISGVPYETDEYKAGTTAVALSDTGDVYTWGSNFGGKLGTGNADTTAVCNRGREQNCASGALLTGVKKLTASSGAFYALKTNGELWAWGSAAYYGSAAEFLKPSGEFGKPTSSTKPTVWTSPQLLKTGVADTFGVTYGRFDLSTSNVLTFSGTGSPGMGADSTGLLFDAVTDYAVPTISTAVGSDTIKDIQTSFNVGLALTSTGKVLSWGSANILLGRTVAESWSPAKQITLPKPVKDFGVGEGHAVAILTDGSLWGWGKTYAFKGDVSNNLDGALPTPTKVIDAQVGTDNLAVATMPYTTFLTKSDFSLLGWGSGGLANGGLLPGAKVTYVSQGNKYVAPISKLVFPGVR